MTRARVGTVVSDCVPALALFLLLVIAPRAALGQAPVPAGNSSVAVGPQYDSTHVYVAPADLNAFVKSVTATFGGQASKLIVTNVLPEPSSTEFQYVWTPVGTMSVFAFETPIPFPFGAERTGYLVTDMDAAIAEARWAGAEVIVAPFEDPIGRDAVIQWPGGVKMQLYWHFTAPKSPPLETIPDNRVYVSHEAADAFVASFVRFARGKVLADVASADAGEIGRAGKKYRRIRITSQFGNMQVLVTDGHLPYPFGREITGYEVRDLPATLEKAKAAGVKVLSAPHSTDDNRISAMVEFPGGYIAEIHGVTAR
jgi:predicted enzyme related to lactoylglutathione lyase